MISNRGLYIDITMHWVEATASIRNWFPISGKSPISKRPRSVENLLITSFKPNLLALMGSKVKKILNPFLFKVLFESCMQKLRKKFLRICKMKIAAESIPKVVQKFD